MANPRAVHADCTHPPTSTEREKCRARRLREWDGDENSLPLRNVPKYHQFSDGEIHELSPADIQRVHGGTREKFESCLRTYASSYGLTLSMVKTPDKGLTLRMWRAEDELSDYLLPELVKRERDRRNRRLPQTAHADCTHPNTPYQRRKCRESQGRISPSSAARKTRAATPDDVLWDSLMAEVASSDHGHL